MWKFRPSVRQLSERVHYSFQVLEGPDPIEDALVHSGDAPDSLAK